MLEINESDFRPIRDFVFIEADAERGRKKKLEDGKEIFIDTDFNPHSTENATQDGIVRYIPTKLESGKRRRDLYRSLHGTGLRTHPPRWKARRH